MRGLKRGLVALAAAAALFAGCGGQQPVGGGSGGSCVLPPRDENGAVEFAHELGIPSSLDDVIAVLGCVRDGQSPLEGRIVGYEVYGVPQERRDREFLPWLADRLDAGDLSVDEARRLVYRLAADPDVPGKNGSFGNVTSLEWSILEQNWRVWVAMRARGMIPEGVELTTENLLGVFLPPTVFLTGDVLTPLGGRITLEGVDGWMETTFPPMRQDGESSFINTLGLDTVTIIFPTDPSKVDTLTHLVEGWYQGFDTTVVMPSSSGIFCADNPDGSVDTSKYPPLYNPLLIPGKVYWMDVQDGVYRDGVKDYTFYVSFEEVPRSLLPALPPYELTFGITHITEIGTDRNGEPIRVGSILAPSVITSSLSVLPGSFFGYYLAQGRPDGMMCYVNLDYNVYVSGPDPFSLAVGGKAFRNSSTRFTLPLDPLNPYVHPSGVGVSFAFPKILRQTDGTLFSPHFYVVTDGYEPDGRVRTPLQPVQLHVPYPAPNDPFVYQQE